MKAILARRLRRGEHAVRLAALVTAAVLVAGCGTTEPQAAADPAGADSPSSQSQEQSSQPSADAADSSQPSAASGSPESAPASSVSPQSSAAAGPIEVTDERGTVRLDKPATRVIAIGWGEIEILLGLGVKPVGAPAVEDYNTYNTVVPLPAETPDIGTRSEPSLEAMISLEPDLVVTTTFTPEPVIKQLEAEVPVLVLRGSDAADPIAYMRHKVEILGKVTGTVDKAEQLLADFDTTVTDAKAALDDAGVAGAPFVMADGYLNSGTVVIRFYTPASFVGAVAAELGLKNQWPDGGDKDYGLATLDVEAMTQVSNPDTEFFYISSGEDNVFEGPALADNAIWQQTSWVTGDKIHRIPSGIWTLGGPQAAEAFVDAFVDELT